LRTITLVVARNRCNIPFQWT